MELLKWLDLDPLLRLLLCCHCISCSSNPLNTHTTHTQQLFRPSASFAVPSGPSSTCPSNPLPAFLFLFLAFYAFAHALNISHFLIQSSSYESISDSDSKSDSASSRIIFRYMNEFFRAGARLFPTSSLVEILHAHFLFYHHQVGSFFLFAALYY